MKERIEEKISITLEHILNKPTEEITFDDYNIMSSELRDIRFRDEQAERNKKFTELMLNNLSSVGGFGSVA